MPEPRVKLYWSQKEQSIMGDWDEGASQATVYFLFSLFGPDVRADLERRGYDIKTLKLQIRRKAK